MRILAIKTWIVILVLVVGSSSVMLSVDTGPRLRDIDEAAWIFNGSFLDLYLAGEWDPNVWREFDQYAQHPPAGKYLFGALEHAIGEPMSSMEPRRYWFENDVQVLNPRSHFIKNLYARMSHRQLTAGRYMGAAFGALAAILFFFLARRFASALPSLLGYALLIAHPDFLAISTLAAIDSFLLSMSILVLLLALSMGHSLANAKRSAVVFGVLLGIALGVSFATKIVAYAWVVPVVLCACFTAGRRWGKALLLLCLSGLIGFAVSYVLDPGLHGEPIAQIASRVAWRLDRLEIQQLLFHGDRLVGLSARACFLLKHLFFMNALGSMFVFPLFVLGFAMPLYFLGSGRTPREVWLALALSVFFIALTLFSLPLAWFRYAAAGLPFMLLPAVTGMDTLIASAGSWHSFKPKVRTGMLLLALLAVLFSAAFKQGGAWRLCRREGADNQKNFFISSLYKFTVINPGASENAHRFMEQYFEDRGEASKAAYQKACLGHMKKGR